MADAALMAIDKALEEGGHIAQLQIASPAELVGDVAGNILRPFLGGVEADYADRVFVLALEEVDDHRFQIGGFHVALAPDPAAAELVDDEVDVLIIALGHDRRRPTGLTHIATTRYT